MTSDVQPGEQPAAGAVEATVPGDGASEDAHFSLHLSAFEGPLDLLLHLIERNELDITEISLAEVADQYLAQLRAAEEPDLARLAEFISVGARLLLLKSRALLPRDDLPADEEDEGDDVSALIQALREYRRFKQAAEFLREREAGHATYRREVPPPEVPLPTGLDAVSLNSLVEVIRDVLARMPEEDPVQEVEREPVLLRDRIQRVVDTLERDGRTAFRQLIEQATSRTMIIVDFMAILELIKQRYLEARQSESFGDIDLVKRGDAGTVTVENLEGEVGRDRP
jgi:segregation and condensation protein A